MSDNIIDGDLTILICSYKATKELKLCLNLLCRFGLKENILLIENSPKDYLENREFLNSVNIKYTDNPGGTHPETINKYLKEIKTKYCLILDSDCFCLTNPLNVLNFVKSKGIDLYGDICGDRGGTFLYKRVHPWYCFVNVEFLNKHNISFVDWERVKKTNSEKLYSSLPVGTNKAEKHYDVGATMFEDILNNGGFIAELPYKEKTFFHKEGSSWYGDTKIEAYEKSLQKKNDMLNQIFEKIFDEKYFK